MDVSNDLHDGVPALGRCIGERLLDLAVADFLQRPPDQALP